jgi:hypothetical protein
VLRGRIGAKERQRAPSRDRAHEDDPAPSTPESGQERLSYRHLPNDIDLELAPQLVNGYELERQRERDASVVDEAVEFIHPLGRCTHVNRIRHVEQDFFRPVRRVAGAADAREDPPARACQPLRAGSADPRRRSRDEDRQSSSQSAT